MNKNLALRSVKWRQQRKSLLLRRLDAELRRQVNRTQGQRKQENLRQWWINSGRDADYLRSLWCPVNKEGSLYEPSYIYHGKLEDLPLGWVVWKKATEEVPGLEDYYAVHYESAE